MKTAWDRWWYSVACLRMMWIRSTIRGIIDGQHMQLMWGRWWTGRWMVEEDDWRWRRMKKKKDSSGKIAPFIYRRWSIEGNNGDEQVKRQGRGDLFLLYIDITSISAPRLTRLLSYSPILALQRAHCWYQVEGAWGMITEYEVYSLVWCAIILNPIQSVICLFVLLDPKCFLPSRVTIHTSSILLRGMFEGLKSFILHPALRYLVDEPPSTNIVEPG